MYFCGTKKEGLLAEWLGTGLQNRLLQFESGRDLQKFHPQGWNFFLFLPEVEKKLA